MKIRILVIPCLLFLGVLAGCRAGPPAAVSTPTSSTTATAPSLPPTFTPEQQITPTAEVICQVNDPRPTPHPRIKEIFQPRPEEDWSLGPADVPVTIVEYADYQCPYCALTSPVLQDLQNKYPQSVRLIYRHFPLTSIHDKALLATQAAEAAGLQGRFWDMHRLLYEKQEEWSSLAPEAFQGWVTDQAEGLGLNRAQFAEDVVSEEIVSRAQNAWEEGREFGIPYTPFVSINYRESQLEPTLFNFSKVVEMIKLEQRQFDECPPLRVDPEVTYRAKLKTEKGDILISLNPSAAPMAVNSFIFLSEKGWYDRNPFYRVIPDFVAQTGDPTGTGSGNPGYTFGLETTPDLQFDEPGVVAMANAGPESNGSQFFITYAPAPHLDGRYTIFGHVIEGMDVLEDLSPHRPEDGLGGDLLLDVEILEE